MLLGDASSVVVHAVIRDIPVGSEFVIGGIRFYDPSIANIACIEVPNSGGMILIDGASAYVPSSGPQFELRLLVAAADCADIEVANITLSGAGVYFGACNATVRNCRLEPALTNPGSFMTSTFNAHQSIVEVVDSRIVARRYTAFSPSARIIVGIVRFRGPSSVRDFSNLAGPALYVVRARIEADPLVVFGSVDNTGGTRCAVSCPRCKRVSLVQRSPPL